MIQDQIMMFLKSSSGYLSGEDISGKLNISRAAIWKNIEELRKQGYGIVAVPHLGYRLENVPDKLFPREIQEGLKSTILGKTIHHYESVSSTMDEAIRWAMKQGEDGTVVLAETQTKGRGRLGRQWVSPKGKGIYMSLILRPQLPPTEVAKITLLGAVAVCEALRSQTPLLPEIKWPNDLLIQGKKIAGLLTEMNGELDLVRFCVIGIGINVNTPSSYLPENSTSLKLEAGETFSRIHLVQEILYRLDYWYSKLNKQEFDPILDRWRELSCTLGQRVRIGDVEGKAVDLDKDGALVIENDAGERTRQVSGDVIQR